MDRPLLHRNMHVVHCGETVCCHTVGQPVRPFVDVMPVYGPIRGLHDGSLAEIRLPAQSRHAADELCDRIRTSGGACIVLKT
jgi:hypothetical protein